ncbi:MAG: PQQ-binding-like beta-propeller repeat protein [Candidatus Promineifilaceae bacterium]
MYWGSHSPEIMYIAPDGVLRPFFRADDPDVWFVWPLTHDTDTLYATGWQNKLYAITLADGHLRWSLILEKKATAPPCAGKHLFVPVKTSAGYALHALSCVTGKVVWTVPVTQAIRISPLVCENAVYIGDDNGTITALDAHSGTLLWQTQYDDKIRNPLTIDQGKLCFTNQQDILTTIDWREREAPVRLQLAEKTGDAAQYLRFLGFSP